MTAQRHAALHVLRRGSHRNRSLITTSSLLALITIVFSIAFSWETSEVAAAQGKYSVYLPMARRAKTTSTAPAPTAPQPAPSGGEVVQQGLFYDVPADGTSVTSVVDKADFVVMGRGSRFLAQLRSSGYTDLGLQYQLGVEVAGPGPYLSSSAACDASFVPPQNQVAHEVGDFCKYVHPNEDWFLHNGKGERLWGRSYRGINYHMNPASAGWRAFARQRLAQDLYGSSSQPKMPNINGFFLDNMPMRIYAFKNQEVNSDGVVREFGSDDAYRSAMRTYLSELSGALRPAGKLWANLIDDQFVSVADYSSYLNYLDGSMNEAWALGYMSTPLKPDEWAQNLARADAAFQSGKGLLAVVQGSKDDSTRQRYGLASYLLISNGKNSYFRYANYSYYNQWWQYSNYDVALGTPKGARYQSGTKWRRDFACGYVEVDPAARTGNIVTTTCSSTIAPEPTPSSSRTALPARIEAENYKAGGEGVGYHDTTSGNSGGAYRQDDVDIQSCTDGSNCYNVGWIRAGEWLAYDVSVATGGNYRFTARVASLYSGKLFHIEVDGKNVTGSLTVPQTGSNQTWANVTSSSIPITSGNHTLRFVAESDSFNLNHITVSSN